MKLLVRNLARFTTEKQLLSLFEPHGKVQFCTLVKDKETGKSKGFGFVEMPKPGEAKAAMKAINGIDIDGNRVRVKKAEDRPDDNTDKNVSAADTAQSQGDTSAASLSGTAEESISEKASVKRRDKTSVRPSRSKSPKPSQEKTPPKQSIWPQD